MKKSPSSNLHRPSSTRRRVPRLSWWQTWHTVVILGGVFLLVAVVTLQLLYPTDRSLPYARIGGTEVSDMSYEAIVERIRAEHGDIPLEIRIQDDILLETTTAEAGIVPDYLNAVQSVTEYSLQARLVPFSFVYKMLLNPSIAYSVEAERAEPFAERIVELCHVAPQDARMEVEQEAIVLIDDQPGQRCNEDNVLGALERGGLAREVMIVRPYAEAIEADVTTASLEPHVARAQAIIERGLTVHSPAEAWPVPRAELASWLEVERTEDSMELVLDQAEVQAFLEARRGVLYQAPGVTRVSYEDGVEIGRTVGAVGQGIDTEITIERIETALFDETVEPQAWVQLTVLQPRLEVQRDYTPTDRGLQALIEQWEREQPGQYGIMVRDLSGKGMGAQLHADREFVPASTFKVFLIYAMMHQIEQGEFAMSDRTSLGLSVQACIDETIINSTNACSLAFFDMLGWKWVHTWIQGQFSATLMDNAQVHDNNKRTSARDLANFLERLERGQLDINGEHRQYLLDLMKRQRFRGGIPAGVPGTTVADKVGFYAGYKHDAAIVYSPRGTYVLVVLGYGSVSDAQFSDLARRVNALMSQN